MESRRRNDVPGKRGQCKATGSWLRLWEGESESVVHQPLLSVSHCHLLCRLRADACSCSAEREWWRVGCCCSWKGSIRSFYTLKIPLFVMEHYVLLLGSTVEDNHSLPLSLFKKNLFQSWPISDGSVKTWWQSCNALSNHSHYLFSWWWWITAALICS